MNTRQVATPKPHPGINPEHKSALRRANRQAQQSRYRIRELESEREKLEAQFRQAQERLDRYEKAAGALHEAGQSDPGLKAASTLLEAALTW